ncbi:MAG: mismatch repair protein MutS [Candidatus Woesearchaeota archaeon]|nr:mismatch repair protein MutS [Candidatus Woesearchaeota archaeon]MDN5327828.1 mismatch repair protein MutS [Candidatus Woesearchaeota archaeon]
MKDITYNELTPAMKQYVELKKKYPDHILFFRMGDFYETFYEDAKIASEVLDITLTSRGSGEKKAPLAGIPYHSINPYLKKLIDKGYKVAIAEQLEDPSKVKGRVVKRGITRIITPGTVLEPELLNERKNNYISCIFSKESVAIATAEVSTGEFFVNKAEDKNDCISEIARIKPSEIVLPESLKVDKDLIDALKQNNIHLTFVEDSFFNIELAKVLIKEVFKRDSLVSFGINEELLIKTIGGLLKYLKENFLPLNNFRVISFQSSKETMLLDYITLRNLEIFENIYDRSDERTLVKVLDLCKTPMGSRLLKKILANPLLIKEKINERLDAVEELFKDKFKRDEIRESLSEIKDLERIAGKIYSNNINPRDLIALKNSLKKVPSIENNLKDVKSKLLNGIRQLPDFQEVIEIIEKTIKEQPSIKPSDGNVIKEGVNEELDKYRNIKENSKKIILELEEKEKRRTGISTLKIGYNSVFGYYIQVSRSKANLVPKEYIQRQTLVNSIRYVTEELKELEREIITAEEKIAELEEKIFNEIYGKIKSKVDNIAEIAKKIALLDVLVTFAEVSALNNYVRPIIAEDGNIEIKEGRHPVVEKFSEEFIPNDCKLQANEMIILTGPNMAGKSTYLRQVCLITLLAQCGCFVPAKEAKISLVDRIFTRVGASDDLSRGQSTFMVEMSETANILNNATSNSLIILDEVGRGTSTYDGISLAWAIAEYIYKHIKAKTIFATHYHALNKLAEEFENIKNYQVLVTENADEIIFLRKVVPGGTDKSYGIHVAKLAGLPLEVIERAKEIQKKLLEEDEMLTKLKGKINYTQKTLFSFKK